jgi:hypothetical protein
MSGRGATELPRLEDEFFSLPGVEEEVNYPIAAGPPETTPAKSLDATTTGTNGSLEAPTNGSVEETMASSEAATESAVTFAPEIAHKAESSTIKRNHSKAKKIADMFLEAPLLSQNDKGRILLARRRHVDLRTVIILNLPNVLSEDQLLKDFFEFELNLGPGW